MQINDASCFDLQQLKNYSPCKSITVNAPLATILITEDLTVQDAITIHADHINIKPQAKLTADMLIIDAQKQTSLSGKIYVDNLTVDAADLRLDRTLELKSPGKLLNKSCTITLAADQVTVLGGQVDTGNFLVESNTRLILPEELDLNVDDLKLSADQLTIKNNLVLKTANFQANHKIKIARTGVITASASEFLSDDLEVKGKIDSPQYLDLRATNTIILNNQSKISSEILIINADKINSFGFIQANNIKCHSDNINLAGQLHNLPSKMDNPSKPGCYSIESKSIELDGEVNSDSTITFSADQCFLYSRAQVNLTKESKENICSTLKVSGKLYLAKGAELVGNHSLKIETKDFVDYGLIKSSRLLSIDINGSGEIHDQGKILSDEHIMLQGSRCWNSGEVDAKGFLNIAFDIFFINGICDFNVAEKLEAFKLLGKLHGRSINITTAFFHGFLSHITAEDTVQLNAFLNLYIGLINASNVSRSTIGELDLGLNITALEKVKSVIEFMKKLVSTIASDEKLNEIVNEQFKDVQAKDVALSGVNYALQLAAIGAKILAFFAPQAAFIASLGIGTASTLLQLALNGMSVKREIEKLSMQSKSGAEIHARDIYPIILNIKNIALAGFNTAASGLNLPKALHNIPTQTLGVHQNLLSLIPSVAGLVGGSVSSQSVFQVDLFSSTITGLSNTMAAVHLSAFKQILASASFENALYTNEQLSTLMASMHIVSSYIYEQHGGKQTIDNETINAHDIVVDSNRTVNNLNLIGEHIKQDRELSANHTIMKGTTVDVNGQIKTQGGAIIADHLSITKAANAQTAHVVYDVKNTDIKGQTQLDDCNGALGKTTGSIESKVCVEGHVYKDGKELKTTSILEVEGTLAGNTSLKNNVLTSAGGIELAGHYETDNATFVSNETKLAGDTASKFVGGGIVTKILDVALDTNIDKAFISSEASNVYSKLKLTSCQSELGAVKRSETGEINTTGTTSFNEQGQKQTDSYLAVSSGDLKGSFDNSFVKATDNVTIDAGSHIKDSTVSGDKKITIGAGEASTYENSDITAQELNVADGAQAAMSHSSLSIQKQTTLEGAIRLDNCVSKLGKVNNGENGTLSADGEITKNEKGEDEYNSYVFTDGGNLEGDIKNTAVNSTGVLQIEGGSNIQNSAVISRPGLQFQNGKSAVTDSCLITDDFGVAENATPDVENSYIDVKNESIIDGTLGLKNTVVNLAHAVRGDKGQINASGQLSDTPQGGQQTNSVVTFTDGEIKGNFDQTLVVSSGNGTVAGGSHFTNSQLDIAEKLTLGDGEATTIDGGIVKAKELEDKAGTNATISKANVDIQKETKNNGNDKFVECTGNLGTVHQSTTGHLEVVDTVKKTEEGYQADRTLDLEKGDFDGSVTLDHAALNAAGDMNFTNKVNADTSCMASKGNVVFTASSNNDLTDSLVTAKNITTEEGSTSHTKNSTLVAEDGIDLEGIAKVDEQLDVIAGKKITLGNHSELQRGQNSHVVAVAPDIEKRGKIDLNHLTMVGDNMNSDQINQLLSDKDLKADELDLITNQKVDITTNITSAQNINVVGSTVSNLTEQKLHSLWLESTVGNTTNRGNITTTGTTTLKSDDGYVWIYNSIKSKDLNAYGKEGININTADTNKNHSTANPYATGRDYATKNKTPEKAPKTTNITASNIYFKSDGNVKFTGATAYYDQLDVDIKGDLILTGAKYKYNYDNSRVFTKDYTARLNGPTANIVANDFINNGQKISGSVMFFNLNNSFVNRNGGSVSASEYLAIVAPTVVNECGTKLVYDSYGSYTEYVPSVIAGGTGSAETSGIGLYINATNLTNDASLISSIGTNYLNIANDVNFLARSNTYTSYREDKRGLFGLSEEHTEVVDTVVGRSGIYSEQGSNIIICNGTLTATATDFVAQAGTYISAEKGAKFYDLVGSRTETKSKSELGIFHSDEKHYDEFVSPTSIVDMTGITLVSKGDITMRGTEVMTPGHFHVEAQNFTSTVSKLAHTYHSDSFGMSLTLSGQQIASISTPVNWSTPLFNGDPTANQLSQLAHSNGWGEAALNSVGTGINLINTANAAINGYRTNTLLQEALKRELPGIYAPSLGFNFTWSQTDSYTQTLGPGSFNVGSADLVVADTVKIKGCPVQSLGDFVVNCKDFIVEGEQLASWNSQKTTNINLTVSAKGDPYQVGISHNECTSSSSQQVNGQFQVGGKLTVNAKSWTIDGANVDAKQLEGHVDRLSIITEQDEAHCSSQSIGASTGGDVCYNQQHGDSRTTSQAAGIHVHDSINGESKEFTVGTFNSTGGQITSDGVNNFTADKVIAKDVVDEQHSSGFSVNGNVKNIYPDTQTNHLLPPSKQSLAIPTTNIGFNKTEYEAKNHTTIAGAQGTHLDVKDSEGTIVTDPTKSKEVTKNESHIYIAPIPTIVEATADQMGDNFRFAGEQIGKGVERITNFFKPVENKTPVSYENYVKGYHYDYSDSKHNSGAKKKDEDKDWARFDPSHDEDPYVDGDDAKQVDISDKEAYALGKAAGITGSIPDYVNEWPEELQGQFYMGMGEGQGTIIAGQMFLAEVGGLAIDLLVDGAAALGLRTFGIFRKANEITNELIKVVEHNFASDDLLEQHFDKHRNDFPDNYDSAEVYLNGARDVIENGIPVLYDYDYEDRLGYIRFIGTTTGKVIFDDILSPGVAKFEFVGTNSKGNITTYYVSSGKDFWRTINGDTKNKNIQPYELPKLENNFTFKPN